MGANSGEGEPKCAIEQLLNRVIQGERPPTNIDDQNWGIQCKVCGDDVFAQSEGTNTVAIRIGGQLFTKSHCVEPEFPNLHISIDPCVVLTELPEL